MHEVGHTLGLRHNFKASTYLSLDEMNDPDKTKDTGLTASVMDYAPANIDAQGKRSRAITSRPRSAPTTCGPSSTATSRCRGGTEGEVAELKKIAARSGEPALAYATDEDTRGIDPDPLSNRFDLGKDPLDYAKHAGRADRRAVAQGRRSSRRRTATAISKRRAGVRRAAWAITAGRCTSPSRYVGGVYVNRSHKGDANGQAAVRRRRRRKAARGAGPAGRAGLQRQAVPVPAGAVQLPGLRRAGSTGASTCRCGPIIRCTK